MKNPYENTKKETPDGLSKFLGELELAVMQIVWERQPVNVREVLTTLNEGNRDLAYTTVMTVMSRLKEKGWLKTEKRGRAYFYRATRARQELKAEAIGRIVRSLLQDFGELAVAQFVKEVDEIHPEQLQRLSELAQESMEEKDE